MPRILEPGQIEALAHEAFPRVRLPERSGPFAARALRLRQLAAPGAIGHAIGDYLRLMAALAEAQAATLATLDPSLPTLAELERARTHRMPSIEARGWPREPAWRTLAAQLSDQVAATADIPESARHELSEVSALPPEWLEAQADAILADRRGEIELAAAPFVPQSPMPPLPPAGASTPGSRKVSSSAFEWAAWWISPSMRSGSRSSTNQPIL